jgi:hypothetical protein
MSGFSVRTFRDGDEGKIVELFNKVFDKYGGFAPRTVEYWRWCCLSRPDVERNGVFLAFGDEQLRGYVVVGSSGNLWEFCVADGEKEVANTLLSEALRYLEKAGASSVNINVPSDSGVVESLRKAGFGKVPAERMFVSTLSPSALVADLVSSRGGRLASKSDYDLGVRLQNVPYGVGKEFSVKFRDGKAEVENSSTSESSVAVELDFADLLSILFGGSSVIRLFLTHRLKVKPLWKLRAVLNFLSKIRCKESWFFPLSDYG